MGWGSKKYISVTREVHEGDRAVSVYGGMKVIELLEHKIPVFIFYLYRVSVENILSLFYCSTLISYVLVRYAVGLL